MKPLVPALVLSCLLAVPAAAQNDPFKGGVNAGNVQPFFGYKLPDGASVGPDVFRADEFFGETLFPPGSPQCAAAATAFEPIKESSPYEWTELETGLHVLARNGASYQVYRFWVAASAKGKKAKATAKGKLKLHMENLLKAVAGAKCGK
jgi:hypothetical protein